MDATDLKHLERCIELATQAMETGHRPFGSLLVDATGAIRFEDHNRVGGGDRTQHPEFAIARWSAANMSPTDRADATVYTSAEHCAMCSAAHGWVGLGRIVYIASGSQVATWLEELGTPPSPVARLSIETVVPGARVEGPVDELAPRVRELLVQFQTANGPDAAT